MGKLIKSHFGPCDGWVRIGKELGVLWGGHRGINKHTSVWKILSGLLGGTEVVLLTQSLGQVKWRGKNFQAEMRKNGVCRAGTGRWFKVLDCETGWPVPRDDFGKVVKLLPQDSAPPQCGLPLSLPCSSDTLYLS